MQTNEEMLDLNDGHPKNPRGKYWEGNAGRLYKAIEKRRRRRLRNHRLINR